MKRKTFLKAIEDAVFMAGTVSEVFTGSRGDSQIPVYLYTYSQDLFDSVNSMRQIEDKLLRPIIKWMKQCLESNMLDGIYWCDTDVCLADMLTKSGSKLTDITMEIIKENRMIDIGFSKKKSQSEERRN